MIRILVVDDHESPEFIEEMKRNVGSTFKDAEVDAIHVNPTGALNSEEQAAGLDTFLREIEAKGTEFWDVAIIDFNLGEVKQLPEGEKIHLPVSIAQAFRSSNRSATVILYSGTLSDYVDELLKDNPNSDAALRRLFKAEISNFFPRRKIVAEVESAIDNPSWLLRLDRLLTKYATMSVGPEESEFKGRTFADLARALRQQDHEGQRLAQLAAEHGIGCLVDLNS